MSKLQVLPPRDTKDIEDQTLYLNSKFEYINQRIDQNYIRQFKNKEWNAAAWKSAYEFILSTSSYLNQNEKILKLKHLRVLVMMKTLDIIENGHYTNTKGVTINVNEPDINIFYREPPYFTVDARDLETFKVLVEVKEIDCLLEAQRLRKESNERIAVLNMASRAIAGGGYKSGEAAQEENIFRRTNYCTRLDSKYNYTSPADKPNEMVGYPLAEYGGAYTRDVAVFRGEEKDGYPLLDDPFTCDFVAVHAPKLSKPADITVDTCEKIFNKIVSLFKICIHNGCKVLVLGALGCGAYNNPPEVVARIFNHALFLWGHFFQKVITCIF